jgi:hypothetical protein
MQPLTKNSLMIRGSNVQAQRLIQTTLVKQETKLKTKLDVASPMINEKVNVLQLQNPIQKQKQSLKTRLINISIPKLTRVPAKTPTPRLFKTPKTPKTPKKIINLPRLNFGEISKSRGYRLNQKTIYTPSLTGTVFKFFSNKTPKKLMGSYGFGIRPIIKIKKRKKKR